MLSLQDQYQSTVLLLKVRVMRPRHLGNASTQLLLNQDRNVSTNKRGWRSEQSAAQVTGKVAHTGCQIMPRFARTDVHCTIHITYHRTQHPWRRMQPLRASAESQETRNTGLGEMSIDHDLQCYQMQDVNERAHQRCCKQAEHTPSSWLR
jgi:hypothetical protein